MHKIRYIMIVLLVTMLIPMFSGCSDKDKDAAVLVEKAYENYQIAERVHVAFTKNIEKNENNEAESEMIMGDINMIKMPLVLLIEGTRIIETRENTQEYVWGDFFKDIEDGRLHYVFEGDKWKYSEDYDDGIWGGYIEDTMQGILQILYESAENFQIDRESDGEETIVQCSAVLSWSAAEKIYNELLAGYFENEPASSDPWLDLIVEGRYNPIYTMARAKEDAAVTIWINKSKDTIDRIRFDLTDAEQKYENGLSGQDTDMEDSSEYISINESVLLIDLETFDESFRIEEPVVSLEADVNREDWPTDGEITAAYEKAYEAYSWFEYSSMGSGFQDQKEDDGQLYDKVNNDKFHNMESFEAYLKEIFSESVVTELLSENIYRDIDGELYCIQGDRGSDIFWRNESHEIVRMGIYPVYRIVAYYGPVEDALAEEKWIKESYPNYTILPESSIENGEQWSVTYDLNYENIDGGWVFTNFASSS